MKDPEELLRVDFLILSMEYLQMILLTHSSVVTAFEVNFKCDYSIQAKLFTEDGISMIGVIKMFNWIDSVISEIQTHSKLCNPVTSNAIIEKHHLSRDDKRWKNQEFNESRQIS